MSLLTDIQKTFKANPAILIIGLIVAGIAIYNYSRGKGMTLAGMQNKLNPASYEQAHGAPMLNASSMNASPMMPAAPAAQAAMAPGDLLPNDSNSEWAAMNPRASGDFQSVNLLRSGYWNGIDTVGSSLRNANLQVRSEPPNPQSPVSIWNNSTITPDTMRVPLEIGCGPQ